jgi:hypothetical protein
LSWLTNVLDRLTVRWLLANDSGGWDRESDLAGGHPDYLYRVTAYGRVYYYVDEAKLTKGVAGIKGKLGRDIQVEILVGSWETIA